jgi:peptide/nickel transport system permease protein
MVKSIGRLVFISKPYESSPMVNSYILRRILIAIVLIWVVLTAIFFMMRLLPGDALIAMSGEIPDTMTPEQKENIKHDLGLDRPVLVQYVDWLTKSLHADFGLSISSKRPVLRDILVRVPRTVELAISSLIVGLLIGIPLGVLTALYHNSFFDVAVNSVLTLFGTLPVYITGIALILIFGLKLGWVPTGGFVEFSDNWGKHLRLLILPSLALGLWIGAVAARMTRTTMLEVLSEDYIRTAKSKGMPQKLILFRHALRNAMIPVVTTIGLQMGALLGGAVMTETVFTWPGIGSALISAVTRRDYPVVQGAVVITVTAFIFTNLLVDIIISYLDPRVTYK